MTKSRTSPPLGNEEPAEDAQERVLNAAPRTWRGFLADREPSPERVTAPRARPPTCVRARVDLEVLGAGEHLAAVGERAREGLLPGVHADVVDELVFGFERLPAAQALVPHADVTQGLEPRRDMLRGDVVHQLVHGAESLVADGRRRPAEPLQRTSSVGPLADELGFDSGAFGEIQQAVGVVVPQRGDQAIVPGRRRGRRGRPLHAPLPSPSLE